MEGDDAWLVGLAERVGGQERLLGRAVATELENEEGRPSLMYWPDFPEIAERRHLNREARWAKSDLSDGERYAFKGGYSGDYGSPLHEPVHDLTYAIMERGVGYPLRGAWQALAEPDPMLAMAFAENLLFRGEDVATNRALNMIASLMNWAEDRDRPHADLRHQVRARGIVMANRILDHPAWEVDYGAATTVMAGVSPDEMQPLLVKFAENVFVRHWRGYDHFWQSSHLSERMTGPFPPHICEAGRDSLDKIEARHDHRFAFCP